MMRCELRSAMSHKGRLCEPASATSPGKRRIQVKLGPRINWCLTHSPHSQSPLVQTSQVAGIL
jgi:hypothetical protein